ncbi:MAG TPA: DUF502 domain-containing protein [Gammaproteobacteria bacterium]
MENNRAFRTHIRRNLITGVLVMIPLWITWLVFGFLFNQLSRIGRPGVRGMSRAVESFSPALAEWLLTPWFQSLLAVIITLLLLYLLGWITSRMVGRHLLAMLESFIARIPLVQLVYGAAKKLIAALQQKPEQVQRVVLIEFPTPEMRALGFVTQVLTDPNTGQKLAAVYVPTTPNPTSGYMEIVPLERIINTDWSVDEAMSFIISGGTISPGNINFENKEKAAGPPPAEGQDESTSSK